MAIVLEAGMRLQPEPPPVPFHELLAMWRSVGFDRAQCGSIVESLVTTGHLQDGFIDIGELLRGGVPATKQLLFDFHQNTDRRWLWVASLRGHEIFEVALGFREILAAADVIRLLRECDSESEYRSRAEAVLDRELIDLTAKLLSSSAWNEPSWTIPTAPGLYRREHANIAIATGRTTLVFDPQRLHYGFSSDKCRAPRANPLEARDYVAITHGHSDHWHLPSIIEHTDNTTRVIVPDVPQQNLLTTECFADSLDAVGVCSVRARWNSSFELEGGRLSVLPFFGEQPTRDPPGAPPGVRCWGNCYRFDCSEFSVLILVDSGRDPQGDIIEAVRANVATDGKVDAIVALGLSFPEATLSGLREYFLSIPFERLQQIERDRLQGVRHTTTSGPVGLAEICRLAGASLYLPHAHGFSGVNREPCEPETYAEHDVLSEVRRALDRVSPTTQIFPWTPGEAVTFQDHVPCWNRYRHLKNG